MPRLDPGFSSFANKLVLWTLGLCAVYYFGAERFDLAEGYAEWHAQLASDILNNFLGEETTVHRLHTGLTTEIRTEDVAYIRVLPGGEGYFAMCFLAAILAWPSSSVIKKFVFCLGAALLSIALHLLHTIVALQFDIWWRYYFDFWIMLGSPATISLLAMLYFLCWMKVSGRHPMRPDT